MSRRRGEQLRNLGERERATPRVRPSGAASHLDPFEQPTSSSALRWAPRSRRLGCYIHLPFCAERCGYCSFNTAPYTPGAMNRLVTALLGEIDLVAPSVGSPSPTLRSVFIGGGTPSLATPDEMSAILTRLDARLTVEPSAEITVECNPESVSRDRLAGYREASVNRISLGVQSLDDRIL